MTPQPNKILQSNLPGIAVGDWPNPQPEPSPNPGEIRVVAPSGDPTGVTDSKAINWLLTLGSRVMLKPNSTYIANITLPLNTFELIGAANTTIMAPAGSNQPVLQTAGFAGLTGSGSLGGNKNCVITGFTIDGNQAGGATGRCLNFYGYNNQVRDIVAQNSGADWGIWTEWGSPAVDPADRWAAKFINVFANQNANGGWCHNGPHDAVLINTHTVSNGGAGFKQGAAAAPGAGSSPNGSHYIYLQSSSNGGNATEFASSAFGWGINASVVPGATALQIDAGAGPCDLTDIALGGGTGLSISSSSHRISGRVSNCTTDAVILNANVQGCDLAIDSNNCVNHWHFNGEVGGHDIRGTADLSATPGAGPTMIAGTPNARSRFYITDGVSTNPRQVFKSDGILASLCYFGAANYTNPGNANADVDAANLELTFIVPPSGAVMVTLNGRCSDSGGGGVTWNLRVGAADVASTVAWITNSGAAIRLTEKIRVTGLTPGQSLTWKWGWKEAAAAACVLYSSATDPLTMEIEAA